MGLSKQETLQLRSALQDAVAKCSERCLYQSAKWAAELLTSIPDQPSELPPTTAAQVVTQNVDPAEARLEAAEINQYLLAKAFFDCREYDRCASVFLPDSLMSGVLASYRQDTTPEPGPVRDDGAPPSTVHGGAAGKRGKRSSAARSRTGRNSGSMASHSTHAPHAAHDDIVHDVMDDVPKAGSAASFEAEPVRTLPALSQKSLFLALYAKLVGGEKRKDEAVEMVMGPHDTGEVTNRQLPVISAYLQTWFSQNMDEDGERVVSQGWLEYLYGMVLAKEKNEKEAMAWFLRSVHRFPMNWGCWLEMSDLLSRVDELNKLAPRLPQHIVSFLFHLHASLELYQQGHHLATSLEQLLSVFPRSAFLLTCQALLAYHSKDLLAAEQHFSALLGLHPHRLEALDHYSNILYVLNLRPKLAFLAHLCNSLDQFRPETCVVVGNYYSLMSAHEKAVQYFRRALHLDRGCLSAWTLMGHEYVELKNTHAAIESYRRAVDVNRRDYRAWYGLGQTYEVLELHTYALWYYKRAAGLRPWDGKMWMAVGSCLQKMGHHREGIKALTRALMVDARSEGGTARGDGSTGAGAGSGGPGGAGQGAAAPQSAYMDPEVLLQIALMYEQLGAGEEAKSYMELCMAQEEGEAAAAAASLGASMATMQVRDDEDDEGAAAYNAGATGESEGAVGTGVTPATSKARMWLARFALAEGNYSVAAKLAGELVQDGVDVEEAKALQREARSALELERAGQTSIGDAGGGS